MYIPFVYFCTLKSLYMEIAPGALLQTIGSPADIKKLDRLQLHQLCDELRQYIIDVVSVHGGHFAASLGVVELTVALHYIYNTPYDQLVWDVGHQAYGHKILTGRRDTFCHQPQIQRHQRLSQAQRKRVRHVWRRSFFHLYLRGTGYGHGCQIQRRKPQVGSHNWRWRYDCRDGF